jgi:hypothetical protein
MAGRLIKGVHATVTAATAGGYLTVASATGLYVGAKCWLSLTAGGSQVQVEITEISGTSIGVRFVQLIAQAPNYGRSDVSAYNGGGFLDQEDQFIYNRSDAPAP